MQSKTRESALVGGSPFSFCSNTPILFHSFKAKTNSLPTLITCKAVYPIEECESNPISDSFQQSFIVFHKK